MKKSERRTVNKGEAWEVIAEGHPGRTSVFADPIEGSHKNGQLALPVLLVAMVLVGDGFTMRHTRFGRTGLMVMMALALGFTLYFIRNFAAILGENGQIPVVLAAWGPPVAAVLLPLGLLLHLEDG